MKKFAIGIFIIVGLFFVRTETVSAQYYNYNNYSYYPNYNTGWNNSYYNYYQQPYYQNWNTPYYNTGWNGGWNNPYYYNAGWYGGWNQGWYGGYGNAQVIIPFNRGGWLSVGLGW